MKRAMFWLLVFPLPFVAMYLYADHSCVPDRHTRGFCGEWIALGMMFPAFFWAFVAVAANAIMALRT